MSVPIPKVAAKACYEARRGERVSEPGMFSLCIFVLSLAGGLRQPVRLFFGGRRRRIAPPTAGRDLFLNYQENQEPWTWAWGDLVAAGHLFPSPPPVLSPHKPPNT